ncbi:MAG: putative transposase [Myxococcota bacterium]|jgi:putative transposase
MDECPVHKAIAVRQAIEDWGATVVILPAYSPELNPIEHLWSALKSHVRAIGTTAWSELEPLVNRLWPRLERHYYKNWIGNCGYITSGHST